MFLSLPHYEFEMPQGIAQPGSRHWRVVELPLHAPWFLLTVQHLQAEKKDVGMSYTLCIAWEGDLADALKAIDVARVIGLVAMMPGWASPTGQWSSRQIAEVWLDNQESGKRVTLKDVGGEKFDAGIRGEPPNADGKGELLLRLPVGKARTLRPRATGSGRGRRRASATE